MSSLSLEKEPTKTKPKQKQKKRDAFRTAGEGLKEMFLSKAFTGFRTSMLVPAPDRKKAAPRGSKWSPERKSKSFGQKQSYQSVTTTRDTQNKPSQHERTASAAAQCKQTQPTKNDYAWLR